jgi:hypothetical protein
MPRAAPVASVKASDYRALCNGTNDDTAAIQAAVDTISVVAGGVESNPPYPRSAATVELPKRNASAGGFPMTSSSYEPICTIQDTAVDGNVALGAVTDLTTTSLTVTEIALSRATTGGGTISCSLTQNK